MLRNRGERYLTLNNVSIEAQLCQHFSVQGLQGLQAGSNPAYVAGDHFAGTRNQSRCTARIVRGGGIFSPVIRSIAQPLALLIGSWVGS
jgi:hypothetical protein